MERAPPTQRADFEFDKGVSDGRYGCQNGRRRPGKKCSDKANPSPLTAQAPNYPRGGAAKALSGPKVKGGSPPADYLNPTCSLSVMRGAIVELFLLMYRSTWEMTGFIGPKLTSVCRSLGQCDMRVDTCQRMYAVRP